MATAEIDLLDVGKGPSARFFVLILGGVVVTLFLLGDWVVVPGIAPELSPMFVQRYRVPECFRSIITRRKR